MVAWTTHVAELTDLINSMPQLPADATCTMELGPHYTLLFDYPDGTPAGRERRQAPGISQHAMGLTPRGSGVQNLLQGGTAGPLGRGPTGRS